MNEPRNTKEAYAQMREISRRRGDYSLSSEEIKSKAINATRSNAARGCQIVVGYAASKTGTMILTIAFAAGSRLVRSDTLDLLALGMGALTAARFLIEWGRCAKGSIGYNELQLNQFADEPEATQGRWGEEAE